MADAIVSAAGMRVIRLLIGTPPQTVFDLMEATGVTRTAITEQLNELVAGGFVERTVERLPGRGRPRHLYRATSAALLLLFADHQQLVVPAIWQSLEEVGGGELVRRVVRRVSNALADHYKRRITAEEPEERLRQLVSLLCQDGAIVEVESDDGQVKIRKRSCGFFSMFEPKRSICHVDELLITEVIGSKVRQVASRHDGDPCCVFEIVHENGR